jgi:hypothetical protein
MFTISGFHKFTEQGDYENGCIGNGSDCFIDYHLRTATLDEMKAKIAGFIGCKVSDLALDACDEVGRTECGKMEDTEGNEATESQLAAWREGKETLLYAVYTAYVMECKPVSALGG